MTQLPPYIMYFDHRHTKVHSIQFFDRQGRRQGPYREYYAHPKKARGPLMKEEFYKDHLRHGPSREWDNKSRIVRDFKYNKGNFLGGKLFKYDEKGRQLTKDVQPKKPAVEQHRQNGQMAVQTPSFTAPSNQNGQKLETPKI